MHDYIQNNNYEVADTSINTKVTASDGKEYVKVGISAKMWEGGYVKLSSTKFAFMYHPEHAQVAFMVKKAGTSFLNINTDMPIVMDSNRLLAKLILSLPQIHGQS
jgi:hypothetical protein